MGTLINYGMLHLARLTPLFVMPSLLPIARLPATIKTIMLVSLTVIIMMSLPIPQDFKVFNGMPFFVAMAQEFIIGLGLIFGVQTTFAAILFAGKVVDLQLGFGVASVLDPMTRTQEALIGSLLNSFFVVAFFILNIHHLLISGFVAVFSYFPVGSGLIVPSSNHLVSFFSSQFILGLLVVMPVILGLFLLDVIIAYTSRTMPQINVYFVSLPLKIFVGLLILSISLKYISGFVENMFNHSIVEWFRHFEVF